MTPEQEMVVLAALTSVKHPEQFGGLTDHDPEDSDPTMMSVAKFMTRITRENQFNPEPIVYLGRGSTDTTRGYLVALPDDNAIALVGTDGDDAQATILQMDGWIPFRVPEPMDSEAAESRASLAAEDIAQVMTWLGRVRAQYTVSGVGRQLRDARIMLDALTRADKFVREIEDAASASSETFWIPPDFNQPGKVSFFTVLMPGLLRGVA
jgi:hypothetical protein